MAAPVDRKPSALRRWFAIHSWLGLSLGLVLAIICGSGAIAVFGHEIDWLLNPALRVEPRETRASFDATLAEVKRAYPAGKIAFWSLQTGPHFADVIDVYPHYRDAETWGSSTEVYVDPGRGVIQGTAFALTARRFLRAFHYYWFDTRTGWGFYLVASFAFVLLAMVITGMRIYRRWWRGLWALRIGRGRRIFLSDLHKLCGAWTLVFNFIIVLTAIYYLVEWIGGGHDWEYPTPSLAAERVAQIPPDATPLTLDAQITNARRAFPELRIGSIGLPTQPQDPLYFDGQATAWLVRNRGNKLLLDPYNGSVVHSHRAEDMPLGYRWVDTVDELHFGTFAGLGSKVVWCAFGLMLPTLFLTGAVLGLRRHGAAWKRELINLRNPLNALGLALTASLLAFATLSTVHSVRESLADPPTPPAPVVNP
jgi:uncharacterized iron-regulated membrane protein